MQARQKGAVRITLKFGIGGAFASYNRPGGGATYAAMASGTVYPIPREGVYNNQITLSRIFNTSNKTSRTVDVVATSDAHGIFMRSSNTDESMDRWYNNAGAFSWGKIVTITLNAPPAFTTKDATSDTNGFFVGISTAKVTVSGCSAKYGGDITQTKLTIGNQSVTGIGNGTLPIKLASAGTFTPIVTVTDSRGQISTQSLSPITVKPYLIPQVGIKQAERTDADGRPDDEGTSAVVTSEFTYTGAITDLLRPSVSIDGTVKWGTYCTWYTKRAADGTLSDLVSWSSYQSSSPVTLYGLLPGTFNKNLSYKIGITPKDGYGAGQEITQTLPQAYYTMVVYAGGHGIAFGAPATEDGFKVAMPAVFTENVILQKMAGAVQMFAGSSAPAGWLFCRGQAVSRTTYAELFAVIGTSYGAGNGSTTFNLPDFRDVFPVGAGNKYALNSKGGAVSVVLNTNQIPAHTHGVSGAIAGGITGGSHSHSMKNLWSNGSGSSSAYTMQSKRTLTTRSTDAETHTHNLPAHEHASVVGGQAHENRPPYIGINFIICTGRR